MFGIVGPCGGLVGRFGFGVPCGGNVGMVGFGVPCGGIVGKVGFGVPCGGFGFSPIMFKKKTLIRFFAIDIRII